MMQHDIYEVKVQEYNELMELFMAVFEHDHFYMKIFNDATTRKQCMEERFSRVLRFCLQHGTVYGIRDKGQLIAFLIAFDYPYFQHTYPEDFLDIFRYHNEKSVKELPYYHELHQRIELLGENVTYMLSIGVQVEHRRKGLAESLIKQLQQDHKVDYIVSDVSNDRSLPMYDRLNFMNLKIEDGYTFVKASPLISIKDLNLTNSIIALPKGFRDVQDLTGKTHRVFKTVALHGYKVDNQYGFTFFKKESSSKCEADLYKITFKELLSIQKYMNVSQYHEEYLEADDISFLLYSLIQDYKETSVAHKQVYLDKKEEWSIPYDAQIMIPMEYEDASLFLRKDASFDEDMSSFLRYLDFRTHYEAGVFNKDESIDDRCGFKRRIKRNYLKKIRVKVIEELNADTYDSSGKDLGEPAYVNLMITFDTFGKAALISIVSLSSPFLISHFMDSVVRNQLFVEYKGEWINLYVYLSIHYRLQKRGTPKLFITILQDRNRLKDEQIASLLLSETIYDKNDLLGCVCDEDILQIIAKKNGMGQYDRAYVYAHTNVCLQFCDHLRTSIKGRLSEEAITYFYIELLGFEEAAIQIGNHRIAAVLTERIHQSVLDYLHHTYDIYDEYAHTIEFWDIQMNYPSSRKSLSMLRNAFKIEEQITYMDRNLTQLQRIFETQRDILDRKENSLLNYIILFLTLLQGFAILFPMFFSGDVQLSYRILGLIIISVLFVLCLIRKRQLRTIHRKARS